MEGRSRISEHPLGVWCLGLVALAIAGGGCVSSAVFSEAERAVARGDYHEAYVIYSVAARANPSSSKVHGALARVAPLAARRWVDAAHDFERRGQYDLAWRCYIRSLLIRPSDEAALAGIHNLEREHADRVAAGKNAWQHYGERSLQTGGVDLKLAAWTEAPAGDDAPEVTAETEPGRPQHATVVTAEDEPGRPQHAAVETAEDGPGGPQHATVVTAEDKPVAPRAEAPLPAAPAPATVADARPTAQAPSKPAVETKPAAVDAAVAAAFDPDASPHVKGGFLTTAIASRDDERFPKVALLLDDIRVRVLDTDPGPDADVSIYRGRRRVHKIRNWRVGEAVGITGRSGRGYEIKLISIFDPTESIRVGIRPIQPAGKSF